MGIGNASPIVRLQVSGTFAVGDDNNGWGRMVFDSTTNATRIQSSKNGTDSVGLSFWTQATGGGFAERMVISGSNVGIGTSNPNNLLELSSATSGGSLRFSSCNNTAFYWDIGRDSVSTGDFLFRKASGGAASDIMRITNDGNVFVNNSCGVSLNGLTNRLSVSSTTYNLFDISRFSDNAFGPNFYLVKSRNGTIGGNTIVANGDNLGNITWVGANGTGFTDAAAIRAEVDGTPGASNDMPGRLVFSTTADGAGSVTERMRIASNGVVRIGTCAITLNTNSNVALQVAGAIRFGNPDGEYVQSYGGGVSARSLSNMSPGSSTIIIKGLGGSGFLYQVFGFTGTGKRFTDLLLGVNNIITVVASTTESGPASRCYTITSENLNLCLSGAETYNIVSHGFGAVER